ncbi:MAG: YraN family protein [Flavisolibacter sp.]|jgi:putative endonuclease
MAVHLELGKKGEELAVKWLIKHGFAIIFRNWRHSHLEIDVIAIKEDIVHFVEVKFRSSDKYCNPEENVTRKKFKCLLNAADEYMHQHPKFTDFRIDILSITDRKDQEPDYFFIEDVYI